MTVMVIILGVLIKSILRYFHDVVFVTIVTGILDYIAYQQNSVLVCVYLVTGITAVHFGSSQKEKPSQTD